MQLEGIQEKLNEIINSDQGEAQSRHAEKQMAIGKFKTLNVQNVFNDKPYKQSFMYAYMRPLLMAALEDITEESDGYKIMFGCDSYHISITGKGMSVLFDLLSAQAIHVIVQGQTLQVGDKHIHIDSITIEPPSGEP